MTSSGQGMAITNIATDIEWLRIAISLGYWHLVVKNDNLKLLLTSAAQEWLFPNATDI